MRRSLRDEVRVLYSYRCGYCGVSESETGALLTIDHFQPISAGGTDRIENLVYACSACNGFKGRFLSVDNESQILHP